MCQLILFYNQLLKNLFPSVKCSSPFESIDEQSLDQPTLSQTLLLKGNHRFLFIKIYFIQIIQDFNVLWVRFVISKI
jgi:hypothetical protein